VFEDTHPHLFDIAGTEDPCGGNTLHVWSGAKAPRLYRPPLDKDDRTKAAKIVRRLRCAISGQVLWSLVDHRSGSPDRSRLR
jgi:hypothetical protein